MHPMCVGSAGVLFSIIVIKFLTKVCVKGELNTLRGRFYNVRFVIPTFCLTLPNSVRVEKFGITRVRRQVVHASAQIIIGVCSKLQAHFLQTAYRSASASPPLRFADRACHCASARPASNRGSSRMAAPHEGGGGHPGRVRRGCEHARGS